MTPRPMGPEYEPEQEAALEFLIGVDNALVRGDHREHLDQMAAHLDDLRNADADEIIRQEIHIVPGDD